VLPHWGNAWRWSDKPRRLVFVEDDWSCIQSSGVKYTRRSREENQTNSDCRLVSSPLSPPATRADGMVAVSTTGYRSSLARQHVPQRVRSGSHACRCCTRSRTMPSPVCYAMVWKILAAEALRPTAIQSAARHQHESRRTNTSP
jgi:hypothetical protein